jgi:predicted SAM-dependent methyltransferase
VIHDSLRFGRRPFSQRRFKQAVAAARPVRVNVGGAGHPLDGWINTDVHWRARHYLDLAKPWPVPAGSIDAIYGDNVIEHLPLEVGRAALRHALVALRPGGAIRLATPDGERTARAYLDDPVLTAAHLDRHRRAGYAVAHPIDLLRVTFAEAGHYLGYIYDFASLTAELEAAGFTDVSRREAGESSEAAFRGLENRAEPTEIATELVVEARRPPV